MSVHEVAEQGFAEADTYDRARPGYPPDAVAWLTDNLRIRPGSTVLDLAAGTGKLTRPLVATGARVVAAEPVGGMRNVLRRQLADLSIVATTAEHASFADHTFDAVTVAQAFHWFDLVPASHEAARILRPGGRIGLAWNVRDRSVDWTDRVWSIMDRVEKRAPWRQHEQMRATVGDGLPGFGPLHEATFRHGQRMTPDDVVARIASVSHVVVLEPDRRDAVLREVRDVIDTHPETAGRATVELQYRVDAYWCERA